MAPYRFPCIAMLLLALAALAACSEDLPDEDDPEPLVPPLGAPGTFLSVGSLSTARYGHRAALITGGDVLVLGGRGSAGLPLASAELYEYLRGLFFPTGGIAGSMRHARAEHTATPLPDGRVLVAGGTDGTAPLHQAEIYNPLTHGFSDTAGPLLYPRRRHAAVRLASGNVLLVGGLGPGGMVLPFLEVYSWQSGTFHKADPALHAARYDCRADLLPDGRVLICGGVNASGTVLSSAEVYSPSPGDDTSGVLVLTEALDGPRTGHAAAAPSQGPAPGEPLFFGGASSLAPDLALDSALHFDPDKYGSAEGFVPVTALMAAPRHGHTATVLLDGARVLIAGGLAPSAPELFDPGPLAPFQGTFARTATAQGAPTAFAAVTQGRSLHTATLLPNGTVLLAGGLDGAAPTATAEIYSP